jgi:branched-chain amino acid transport system substrate-binding protein
MNTPSSFTPQLASIVIRAVAVVMLFAFAALQPVSAQDAPAVCAADEWGCARIAAGDPVKFAIAAPLTGDSAGIGLSYSQAMQLAIMESEPIAGFALAQVDENDRGTREGAVASAERIIADPNIVALVGHAFSGATLAALPLYEAAGIPLLSPTATNPTLSQQGSRVFNRTIFNDNAQGDLAARYLYDVLNIRRLALIDDGSVYAMGLAAVARDRFIELGGEIVGEFQIEPDLDDYTAVLLEVAATEPEAIFFPGYTVEVAVMVQNLDDAELRDVVFIGSDGVNTGTLIELAGDAAEGVYLTGEALPPETDAKIAFDALYRATFGAESDSVSRAIWNAYDAARIVIEAVRAVAVVGDDGALYIPRGGLIMAIRSTDGYQGVSGTITCDEVGECNTVGPDISFIQDGTSVRVPMMALDGE